MVETKTRRRGTALETAILDAAWAELAVAGYSRLSMEGVAARAGTSKAVLYRRWPNRAGLIIAALRRQVGTPLAEEVPDTGSLRGDLLALLRRARDHFLVMHRVAPDALHSLLAELDPATGERELLQPEPMRVLLERAGARGELDPAAIPPRVRRLPLDLHRHEVLVTGAPPGDHAIAEMVDQVVLPALRAAAAAGRPES